VVSAYVVNARTACIQNKIGNLHLFLTKCETSMNCL
jgi:hypothetical protein